MEYLYLTKISTMGAAVLTEEMKQVIINNYHNDSNIKGYEAQLNYIISIATPTYTLSEDGIMAHYFTPSTQKAIDCIKTNLNNYIKSAYPEMITPNSFTS